MEFDNNFDDTIDASMRAPLTSVSDVPSCWSRRESKPLDVLLQVESGQVDNASQLKLLMCTC